MDKQTTIQAVLTAAFAAISYYFDIIAIPVIVLIAMMIIDYVTGMISAWHNNELSSKKGLYGIIKKLCYIALVAVGMAVDYLIYSALGQLNIHISYTLFFGLLVTLWLIINELISILENLGKIGIPLPKFIKSITKKLKNTVESTANKESEE